MSSPAGVGNPCVRDECNVRVRLLLLNQGLEFLHLPYLLEGENFIFLVTVDRNTSGIISSVFKPGKTYFLVNTGPTPAIP